MSLAAAYLDAWMNYATTHTRYGYPPEPHGHIVSIAEERPTTYRYAESMYLALTARPARNSP